MGVGSFLGFGIDYIHYVTVTGYLVYIIYCLVRKKTHALF